MAYFRRIHTSKRIAVGTARFGLFVGLVITLITAGSSSAQTFGVALSYEGALEPEVQIRDLELGAATLDLRLADGLTGPLELGAAVRFRSSFGPLGTVSALGRADVDTVGGFGLGIDASGALAATGLDASLDVFNRNPGAFAPTAAYTLDPRPFFPVLTENTENTGVGAYLAVGATQRLGRTLLLEATPELSYQSGLGLGVGLSTRLQLRRLIDSDNGVVLLEAHTGPGAGRAFVAGGAEYQLNRRGLPSLTGALLLGGSDAGLRPGFRGSASGEVSRVSYRAELAAEPYRITAPPYRANLALGTELGPGVVGLELGAALANDFGVAPFLLRGFLCLSVLTHVSQPLHALAERGTTTGLNIFHLCLSRSYRG